ncbi:hypothetical protein [Meiothermus cerbereus]|uniref:hypothetical protein n=1 Tax=Meiothermus cerbereus TaxID=65552 RepID=UPI003EEFA8C4
MVEARLNREKIQVFSSFEEMELQDRLEWWGKTPLERIHHIEFLRRLNYGDAAFERLQRVFEVAERA